MVLFALLLCLCLPPLCLSGNDWTVEQTSGGETTALFLNICDVCTKTCGHTEPLAVAAFHKQGTTLNGCIPLGFIKEQKIEEIGAYDTLALLTLPGPTVPAFLTRPAPPHPPTFFHPALRLQTL